MGRNDVLSAFEIEQRIDAGEILVIFESHVLRMDNWLSKHPGGRLAVLHMVGRDATDQISVYHSRDVQSRMKHFRIGQAPMPWTNLTPPVQRPRRARTPDDSDSDTSSLSSGKQEIQENAAYTRRSNQTATESSDVYASVAVRKEIADDLAAYPSLDAATQRAISDRYKALLQRIEDEGFYNCNYWAYGREVLRYLALFSAFLYALRCQWFITSACFLGLFWHQIMFTAHDSAHLAVTHDFKIDTIIACFIADFCCGLSIGWWKRSHNVHHLVTNLPEHDPDIQNVPVFATSPSFFQSVHSSYYDFDFDWDAAADWAVPHQAWTYYPIMAIARFNLYLLSWLYLLSPHSEAFGAARWVKRLELTFMACYWFLFGYCLLWCCIPTWTMRVVFVLVSHIITMILHVQITLSHFGMSTADLGTSESFAQHQLRTTMDVECPAWLDFFHGGLQFQAVHHLFPRVPRHNLRRLQSLVREFAQEINVEYKILGFVDGNKKVLGRLSDVANQAKLLYQCR